MEWDECIDAKGVHYRDVNRRLREVVAAGAKRIRLLNVCGHRYIGAGMKGDDVVISIDGVPGNDLACFMAGPRIEVNGNGQDGVANTMGRGRVVVRGSAGDVMGYSMRGGEVYVRGYAGFRVGIHMKAYKDMCPVIIVGEHVGDYFGEYMAGGILVVLGLHGDETPIVGDFVGTGMHGGEMYIRGEVDPCCLGKEVGRRDIDDDAWERLNLHLEEFCREFGIDRTFERDEFTRLVPVSTRPYGRLYVY